MTAQVTQTITSLGTPPQTSDPTNFDARADALLATGAGGLPNMVTELDVFIPQVNAVATDANLSAVNAAASAAAASALAGAVAFNPATAYAQYQAAISTVTLLTYRRKTAGTSATDPSADTTNWVPTGAPPVVVVSTAVDFTAVAGVIYILTASNINMTLASTPGTQDIFHYRLAPGISQATLKGNGNKIENQTLGVDVSISSLCRTGRLVYTSAYGYLHVL